MKARQPKGDKKKRRSKAKRSVSHRNSAARLQREREAREAKIIRKYGHLLNRQAAALVREQADLSRIDPFSSDDVFLRSADALNPTK